jgi:hypothetical protein
VIYGEDGMAVLLCGVRLIGGDQQDPARLNQIGHRNIQSVADACLLWSYLGFPRTPAEDEIMAKIIHGAFDACQSKVVQYGIRFDLPLFRPTEGSQ